MLKVRKVIEVEYVGIEDMQDIMDDIYALQREGHYASLEISNLCDNTRVEVKIMLDGWKASSLYDYSYEFCMSEDAGDVAIMQQCKNTLKNLLAEE